MRNEVDYLYTTLNASNSVKTQLKHEPINFTPFLLGFVVGFICLYLIIKHGREDF
jgi:hypothetical protein